MTAPPWPAPSAHTPHLSSWQAAMLELCACVTVMNKLCIWFITDSVSDGNVSVKANLAQAWARQRWCERRTAAAKHACISTESRLHLCMQWVSTYMSMVQPIQQPMHAGMNFQGVRVRLSLCALLIPYDAPCKGHFVRGTWYSCSKAVRLEAASSTCRRLAARLMRSATPLSCL